MDLAAMQAVVPVGYFLDRRQLQKHGKLYKTKCIKVCRLLNIALRDILSTSSLHREVTDKHTCIGQFQYPKKFFPHSPLNTERCISISQPILGHPWLV